MADKHSLEAMLGSARFQKYYEAAAQDVDRAGGLYRWNTRLAGEFHAQLSYFEILLRNAMDSAVIGIGVWSVKLRGFSMK
ncbi:hypothetical protein QZG57_09155 [Corynebacterium glucuronolyticum]|uniref:hypothetical protein n=1 Tax=Corynebacterium glucuronolyticum TaxID=39791 RepID=UPI003F6E06CB